MGRRGDEGVLDSGGEGRREGGHSLWADGAEVALFAGIVIVAAVW